jgi:hypothetical protein
LENSSDAVDITRAWETTTENIKISAKEGHVSMEVVESYQQAKLQWLQDSSQINGDKLNNARCEAGKHFRSKKREFMSLQHRKKLNSLRLK